MKKYTYIPAAHGFQLQQHRQLDNYFVVLCKILYWIGNIVHVKIFINKIIRVEHNVCFVAQKLLLRNYCYEKFMWGITSKKLIF